MRPVVGFVIFMAAVMAAATIGSSFLPGEWYQALAKPAWTPPNWLFAPVWTVLYVMIGFAGWLVWRAEGASPAVAIWIVQLGLNAAWSWVMFGLHYIGAALGVIAVLWLAILLFIVTARRTSGTAAALFVPYLAWVSFAAALNFEIWRLNP
jgi:tryptophan-rich sensory protein